MEMSDSFFGMLKILGVFCAVGFVLGIIGFSITAKNDYDRCQQTEYAVETYKSEGGSCYVDGVKQEKSFSVDGLNWALYSATYENGALYIKHKTPRVRQNYDTTPVVIPMIH